MAGTPRRNEARQADESDLPQTSWAVLGLLSHAKELSGYDLKKWADWSLQFFYWSPSYSQIYSELKRLERLGYARSRTVMQDDGLRGKRMYAITASGRRAAARWVNNAPIEPPVLKHSVMLRVWLGHLAEPARLRELLEQHLEYTAKMSRRAAADAEGAEANPDWSYPAVVLRWCARYYEAEHHFTEQLLTEIIERADQGS